MTVSIPILSSNPNLYKHGPFDVTCWFPNRVSLVPPSELISADFIRIHSNYHHTILFTVCSYTRTYHGLVIVEARQIGRQHGFTAPVSQAAYLPSDSLSKRNGASTTIQSTTTTTPFKGAPDESSGPDNSIKRTSVPSQVEW